MYWKKASSEEIKTILISILEEVNSFCEEKGISYYLFAGTLLGAVRHHGFIPWDDDVDICMRRNEYERFIREYKGKTTSITGIDKDSKYCYPFAKVLKENTRVTEKCNYATNIGIYVDVFPIDNIPNEDNAQRKYIKTVNLYRNLLSETVYFSSYSAVQKIKAAFHLIIHGLGGRYYYAKRLNEVASQYKDNCTGLCGNMIWGQGILKEAVSCSVFNCTTRLMFEGKEFPVPMGYELWLSKRYGNYMKIPPLSEQMGHGNDMFIGRE